MGRQSSFYPFSNMRRSSLKRLSSPRPFCLPCSIPLLFMSLRCLCATWSARSNAESWQESGAAASPTQPLSLHLRSKAPFSFQLFLMHLFIFVRYSSSQLIIITKVLLMTIQNKNVFNHQSAKTLQAKRRSIFLRRNSLFKVMTSKKKKTHKIRYFV